MEKTCKYRILISDKVKQLTIKEAYEYIDAIQSFKGDWPLYLAPEEVLAAERGGEVESITPIPATYGALAFLEFYVDEERLAEELAKLIRAEAVYIRGALERGVPLHRLAPAHVLEELEDLGEYIRGYLFEAGIPLERALTKEEASRLEEIPWVTEVEVLETEMFGVEPRAVEEQLERSYYVGEYLRRLERLFMDAAPRKGHLALIRGTGDASNTLEHLESSLEEIVCKISAKEFTLMYARLVLPI
ncbi:MAG: hypothetical protein DRK00_04485 [Thermoprotei archaeon]|nr:MAG: hypothetical protein DRK00_04485 [Thermoprotei archaeon]